MEKFVQTISSAGDSQMRENGSSGSARLLKIGVLLFSVVSFFTTANGMNRYIFTGNTLIAYLCSGAIQIILLALSLNFLGFWRGITRKEEKNAPPPDGKPAAKRYRDIAWARLPVALIYAALSLVSLFLSSYFSYVFIADVLYKDSWKTESELLVQQTYRSELYGAQEYASVYRMYITEQLGSSIVTLSTQAKQLSDQNESLSIEWGQESQVYQDSTAPAYRYVSAVISAMDNAMANNAPQESRDLAAGAISDAEKNIQARIATIQDSVERQNRNLNNAQEQIQSLTNRLNAAADGTDTTALTNAINTNIAAIESATNQLQTLEEENTELENALNWLSRCNTILGMNNSTSATAIRSRLIQLQTGFYQQEPDEDELLTIATGIFEDLQRAVSSLTGGESDNKMESYTGLMQQMNRLIQGLKEYSAIKEIENNLAGMIEELRAIGESIGSGTDTGPEPGVDGSGTDEDWKQEWETRLNNLKAQISAMPTYIESAEDAGASSGTNAVLSDTQRGILRAYDRDTSSRELDEMLRLYLSGHNEVYQGLIYLQSPYNGLAVFAAILATCFDLSGFVFSFATNGGQEDRRTLEQKNGKKTFAGGSFSQPRDGARWGILATKESYRILTGDYEKKDGIYYYKSFKNGILENWAVNDTNAYTQGIYLEDTANGMQKGKPLPENTQELHFANEKMGNEQGAASRANGQDGIYRNCRISYNNGGLYLEEATDGTYDKPYFITAVNEYLPVHIYNAKRREASTLPAKKLFGSPIQAKELVIALNREQTSVAKIYALEQPQSLFEKPEDTGNI